MFRTDLQAKYYVLRAAFKPYLGYIRDLKKSSQITLRLLGYAKKAFATF